MRIAPIACAGAQHGLQANVPHAAPQVSHDDENEARGVYEIDPDGVTPRTLSPCRRP